MRCFVRGHQYASLCQSSLWKWSHSSKRDELSKVRIRDLTFFRSKARTKMFAKEKLLYQTTSQRTIFHDNCVNKATGGELEIAFSLMTGSPVPILVPEHPLIAQRVSDINKKNRFLLKMSAKICRMWIIGYAAEYACATLGYTFFLQTAIKVWNCSLSSCHPLSRFPMLSAKLRRWS